MKKSIVCQAGQGHDYWVWGDLYSFKATGEETSGKYALVEMTANPGSGTPPHIHHAEDEMFYVLKGELTLWLDQEKSVADPGTFVAVPKGTVHRWSNESQSPATVLVFLVPAGFEAFLMKIGTPVEDLDKPGPALTQESLDYAMSIAGEYHMEIPA